MSIGTVRKDNKTYYCFNKVVESPYALQHIYPIKQRALAYILDHLPDEIRKVYVFGSSLTLDCGTESDIDLLIIADKTEQLYKELSKIIKAIDTEVDLIIKTEAEFQENLADTSSICTVVNREGLLIYERSL